MNSRVCGWQLISLLARRRGAAHSICHLLWRIIMSRLRVPTAGGGRAAAHRYAALAQPLEEERAVDDELERVRTTEIAAAAAASQLVEAANDALSENFDDSVMTAELQPLHQKQGKGVPSSRVPTGASLGPQSGWSRVKRALSVAETFAELVSGGSTGAANGGSSSHHRDEGKRLEAGDTLQDVVVEVNVHSVRYSHDMCTLFAATLPMGIQAVDVQTSTITAPAPQNTNGGVICVDFNADETRACINALNGMVRMYDTTDRSSWEQPLWSQQHSGPGLDVRFTCDNEKVVTANLGEKHLTVHDASVRLNTPRARGAGAVRGRPRPGRREPEEQRPSMVHLMVRPFNGASI